MVFLFGLVAAVVNLVVVGIENQNISNELKIVPNPFQDAAIVHLPNQSNSPMNLFLYDLTGKLIREQKVLKENQETIYKNSLKPGLYFLELRGDSNSFIGKVVIQ